MDKSTFRNWSLAAALVTTFVTSLAFAGVRDTEFAFDNGSRIDIEKIVKAERIQFQGLRRAVYTDFKSKAKTKLKFSFVDTLQLIPSDTDSMNTHVLLTEGAKLSLVDSSGNISKIDLDAKKIQSWRGAPFKVGAEEYFALSILNTDSRLSTSIVRLKDGMTLPVSSRYQDFSKNSISVSANGVVKLDVNSPAVDVRNFDALAAAAKARGSAAVNDARAALLRDQVDVLNVIVDHLKKKVFGQDALIRRLSHYYVNPPTAGRPTVLVLTGPSGVGKSYLGLNFAQEIFNDPKMFLEIDGTEHMAAASDGNIEIHKLVGAPLGQMGMQKGSIIDFLQSNSGDGVMLINEADKMHPDTWKRLMELFDKGVITSGGGRTVKARKLYIILTSNRGAPLMFPPTTASWSQAEINQRLSKLDTNAVKSFYMMKQGVNDKFELPREIINRVTEFLVAAPISNEAAILIAKDTARSFNRKSRSKYGVTLRLSDKVLAHLALTGFSSTDDGRQIRNQVERYMAEARQEAGKAWPLDDDSVVNVELGTDALNSATLEISWRDHGGQTHQMVTAAPIPKSNNPLADDLNVQRIQRLQPVLNERIIGQPQAVTSVVDAVTAQRGDGSRTRPISLFLVGSTGTGKTEMGRAIAEALYDSAKRISIIALGNVQTDANFNKIFGVEPGHQGSDVVREFEKALQDNPEGGVIVFDEASNMGAGNKDVKNALFKKLYDITEEGKWTSPIGNKVYDLSKHVFLFTGNDGETLFQGVTSEEMRLSIWRKNSSRDQVREMLLESGIPEAFLNRMADSILLKPLTRGEIDRVVIKLLNDRIRNFETQFPGLKISYDSEFVKKLGDSFFMSERGGRSIRSILEDRLPALVTRAVLNSGINRRDMRGVEMKFSLSDNVTVKPYLRTGSPVRVVEMNIDLLSGGRKVHSAMIDLTDFATARRFMNRTGATSTGYHEAGHAIVNDPSVTAEEVSFISIEGGKYKDIEYLGYAKYEPIDGQQMNPTRRTTVIRIGQVYAGVIAQEMAGYEADAGFGNDLKTIRQIAADSLLKWGNDPALIGIRLNADGEPILTARELEIFTAKRDQLIEEGRLYAEKKLSANWPLVRTIVAELLSKGHIAGPRFKQLQAAHGVRTPIPRDEVMREQARSRLFETPGGGRCQALFR